AFRLVYKKYPEAMLVLVGDGELKDQLRTRALELDIAPQVLFAGRSEGEALFAWFNLAQVMVLPSHYEPFGAVVNELMLAGARILCSQYAGASSIVVNDVNGQVFDPADIKAFAAILEKYFDSIVPATPGSNIRPSRMLVNFNDCTANLENKLLGL
ncbi:MAG: glycosyltransferase, partial [Sphingobacteriales bacterium]